MKKLILLIISLMYINTMFCQPENTERISPTHIWGVIDVSWIDEPPKDWDDFVLLISSYDIQSLPENMQALIVYFATLLGRDMSELAELLGFSTLEEAYQKLSKKWIVDVEKINEDWFSTHFGIRHLFLLEQGLAFIRLDKKIIFNSGNDVFVFEEREDGKMILIK